MIQWFWLTSDTRVRSLHPLLPEIVIPMQAKLSGDIGDLNTVTQTVFNYSKNPEDTYDILDAGLFMISERVKKIFEIAQPDLKYKMFCITDDKSKNYDYYYAPILMDAGYESEKIPFQAERNTQTIRILSEEDHMGEIFKVGGRSHRSIIVSLAVAEKLLQVGTKNIRLFPVVVEHRNLSKEV